MFFIHVDQCKLQDKSVNPDYDVTSRMLIHKVYTIIFFPEIYEYFILARNTVTKIKERTKLCNWYMCFQEILQVIQFQWYIIFNKRIVLHFTIML